MTKRFDFTAVRHSGSAVKWDQDREHDRFHVYVKKMQVEFNIHYYISDIEIIQGVREEIPFLSPMLQQESIVGTISFKFFLTDADTGAYEGEFAPDTGIFGAVFHYAEVLYRSKGIVLIGKLKSYKQTVYKWKDPHLDVVPEWTQLLLDGKFLKEKERMLCNRLIKHTGKINVLFVDMEKDMAASGIIMPEACDGGCYMREPIVATLTRRGVDVEQKYQAVGFRILHWKSSDGKKEIVTSKGLLNTNVSEFERLCKVYCVDPKDIDVIHPLVNLKVSNGIEDGDVLSFTPENFWMVSYVSDENQHRASINLVTLSSLIQYAGVFSELVNRQTRVDSVVDIICRSLKGDMDAYKDLVRSGKNEDVNAEVCGLLFPLVRDGEWKMPRLVDYIRTKMIRIESYHKKHVRKVNLRDGLNRRAGFSRTVELWNRDNETGTYIVQFKGQTVYVPQKVMKDRTLGDFDGDNLYAVKIAKGVYIFWRYPVVGPNSVFIGLVKGKSVKDVPEWAMPIVKAHKKCPVIPEEKGDKVSFTDIKPAIEEYFDQLLAGVIAGPQLGMATNRLVYHDINRIVMGEHISHEQMVDESNSIERKGIKAIKSNLTKDDSLTANQIFDHIKASSNNKMLLNSLNWNAKLIRGGVVAKLDSIFTFDSDTRKYSQISHGVWGMCTKTLGIPGVGGMMDSIIGATHFVYSHMPALQFRLPIVRAMKGYLNIKPSDIEMPHAADAVDMYKLCQHIIRNPNVAGFDSTRYRKYIVPVSDTIRTVNSISSITVPRDRVCADSLKLLVNTLDEARMIIENENATGERRRYLMGRLARTILYICMGLASVKDKNTVDITLPVNAFRTRTDQYGRHLDSARVRCSLMNVQDTELRSFGFSAMTTFMKQYIHTHLTDYMDRFYLMIDIGTISFVENKSRGVSPKLWNLCFSVLGKDIKDVQPVLKCSKIWHDAVASYYSVDTITYEKLSEDMSELVEYSNRVDCAIQDGDVDEFNQASVSMDFMSDEAYESFESYDTTWSE